MSHSEEKPRKRKRQKKRPSAGGKSKSAIAGTSVTSVVPANSNQGGLVPATPHTNVTRNANSITPAAVGAKKRRRARNRGKGKSSVDHPKASPAPDTGAAQIKRSPAQSKAAPATQPKKQGSAEAMQGPAQLNGKRKRRRGKHKGQPQTIPKTSEPKPFSETDLGPGHSQPVSNPQKSKKRQKKKNKKNTATLTPTNTKPPPPKGRKLTALQQKMKDKLEGGRFRWLNEKLYTCTGAEAFSLLKKEPILFQDYHEGFRLQVEKWPVNPVDVFIRWLRQNPTLVAGDFGCGDAKLAASVSNKVFSMDLVATNDSVIVCDLANIPLASGTLDAAIFSLSLMGTDFLQFLREAHRSLKPGGQLRIAEVTSRLESGLDAFVQAVQRIGFTSTKVDEGNPIFCLLDFVKASAPQANSKRSQHEHPQGLLLKACRYKKR